MKGIRFAAFIAVVLWLAIGSQAQSPLFWDANPTTGGVQAGNGNWLGGNTWLVPLGNNSAWQDGRIAVFSAAAGQVTVNGNVTANGLTFSATGYQIFGPSIVTLGGATPTIFVSNAGDTATISAPLAGTAGLIKGGDGTVILTRQNSYTGPTTINAGTVTVSGFFDSIPNNSAVVIANVAGATLNISGGDVIGSLAGGGAAGGTVSVGGELLVGADNTSTTFDGIINSTGYFAKTGTGTLTLTRVGTFSGGITIAEGALQMPGLSDSSVALAGTLIYPASASAYNNVDFDFQGGEIRVATFGLINGEFTGSGGFTKSGPGTLRLNGHGSFTGPTTIVEGTLQFTGDESPIINSTITLADVPGVQLINGGHAIGGLAGGGTNGGTLLLEGNNGFIGGNNASTTFSGRISGSASMVKVGTGVLTLTGANTYAGSTFINGGTLRIRGGNAIPNNSFVIVSALGGSTLELDNSDETIGSLNGGGLVKLENGTLVVAGVVTSIFSGTITGTGGLTKGGAALIELSGANSFSGPTTINGGMLRISSATALSNTTALTLANVAGVLLSVVSGGTIGSLSGGGTAGGGVVLGSDRTLTIGGNHTSTTYNGIISGAGGSIVKTGTGTLTFGFTHTFTGDLSIEDGAISVGAVNNNGTTGPLGAGTLLNLGGAGTIGTLLFTTGGADSTNRSLMLMGDGGAIDVRDAAGALTLSGAVAGSGGLTKAGAGVLLVSGNNTYTGPTTVSAGRLQLSGGNGVGDNSAITMNDVGGATIELLSSNETVGSLAGGGTNGGNVVLGNGTLTVGGDHRSTVYAGTIEGGGSVTKSGTGTMTFSGTNSYTGTTNVEGGTLRGIGGSAIADTSAVVLAATALLDLSDSSEAIGSLSGNGDVTLGTGTLTIGSNDASSSFTGQIRGSGGLTKTGAGTFTLLGASNFTGATNVTAGILSLEDGLGSPGGPLTISGNATLQARNIVNRPISGPGAVQASGGLYIGDPSSNRGFDLAGSLNVGSNLVVLLDADTANLGVSTTIAAGGRLDAANGITLGTGRNLSASASGTILAAFVNQGTVNGPAGAGQLLTFTEDVSGAGNFTGNVLFSDAFSPGMSAAAVSLENFAFDGSTTLSIELGGVVAGTEYDRLNFTGSGLLQGRLTVSLINGYTPQAGHGFTIISGGVLSGAFDSMTLPPLDPELAWHYTQTGSTAQLFIVPEPASAALLALSLGALVSGRRRRTCMRIGVSST